MQNCERRRRASSGSSERERSTRSGSRWMGCRETELAAPLATAVGLRRYCRVHYDEYIERRQSRVSRSALTAGGRSRRRGG